jgi:hypothetical protein
MQYIQLQSQDPNSLNTPLVGNFNIFVDQTDNNLKLKDSAGEVYGGGGGYNETTYSGLVNTITTSGLTPGSFYLITDFRTCYDQPNYNFNGEEIQTGNYKEGGLSPIIVFAISSSSLASDAYQPEWPNDNIKYDISFNQTEVTSGTSFGRITYRKDNQGNSFDYDFREVLFKRYDAYVSEQVYNGTVSIDSQGIVTGTNTSFENSSVGDIVGILKNNSGGNDIVMYYEIVSISGDTNMVVTGNTINTESNARLVDANLLEGMSWKKNNIISNTDDYEYPTFENYESAFNNISLNNTTYTQYEEKTFLLPNNVFRNDDLEYPNIYIDNLFGSDFRNNTFIDGCDSNIIRDNFRNNIITDSFDHNTINNTFRDNIIDCNFNSNTISGSFYENHLGDEDGDDFDFNTIDGSFYRNFFTGASDFEYNIIKGSFYENTILDRFSKNTLNGFYENVLEDNFENNQIGEECYSNTIYTSFYDNTIGVNFYDNTIYSNFYSNTIGRYFNNNTLGDLFNTSNFDFYRNRIGEYFEENEVRQDFQNNQIGNQFNNNTLNGDFYKNVISNGFNNNQNIGHDFYGNHIGNGFNNNDVIGDYFEDNQIGEYFEDNNISYNFKNNQIGNLFENNTLGNTDYFNWDNTSIENLTGRTYDNFYDSLYGDEGNNIGNIILGKELIMHDTVNDEYHKVKFTQWTQSNNGGGFSYERTKVYPTSEATVYFTKRNYEDIADVIVEGSLEIKRDNGGAIYNQVEEGSWEENVSPYGTEWNSIYTQNNNGSGFEDNIIGNEFKGNLIFNNFSLNNVKSYVASNQFSGSVYTNEIGAYTFDNDFLGEISDNKWIDWFYNNNIGLNFYNNTFGSSVSDNNIADDFQNNEIGCSFNDNNIGDGFGFGYGDSQGNKIGNNFSENTINEYFYNNSIPDNFYNNTIGNYFQWNVVNTNINGTDFTPNYGNITGFTYIASGTGATDNIYYNVQICGSTTSEFGVLATFDVEVSGGTVTAVSGNTSGKLYITGDTLTITGNQIGGAVPDDNIVMTVTGIGPKPSVYGTYTCQLFERQGGTKRLSFYDENDTLTITNINE